MRFPDPPAQGEFVLDLADILTPEDRQLIRSTARRLLAETDTPLLVVTVASLADYHATSRMDEFACRLLAAWRAEHPQASGAAWSRAIVLLVSRGDRQVRIELAPAWAHQKDTACHGILDDAVLPALRRDDYSTGIRNGTRSLDQLVRDAHRAGDKAFLRPLRSERPGSAQSGPDFDGWVKWLLVFVAGFSLVVALVCLATYPGAIRGGGPWPGTGGVNGGWFLGGGQSGGSSGGGFSGGAGGDGGGGGGCSGGGASGSF
jgi:uncharacterized protein